MWISSVCAEFICPACGANESINETLRLLSRVEEIEKHVSIKLCSTCASRMIIQKVSCHLLNQDLLEDIGGAFI